MRCPSFATIPASTVVACSTRVRSAAVVSVGETQPGSRSMARHTDWMWSSPTAPASTAAASSGNSGGSGGPVNERRGRIRTASLNRRVISLGVIRSRFHNIDRICGVDPVSSGGSAISAKKLIHQAAVSALLGSKRSATSTRKLLPTRSDGVSRNRSWAASIASRAEVIRSRASSALIAEPIFRSYESARRFRPQDMTRGEVCGSTVDCG